MKKDKIFVLLGSEDDVSGTCMFCASVTVEQSTGLCYGCLH